MASYAQDIPLITGKDTSFTIKGETIKRLLEQIHKNPDKKNLFGYMVERNARRWVFSTMRELLLDKDHFQRFVQHTLEDQYFAFEQIIIFVRNILTHSIDAEFTIEKEGIIGQRAYLADRRIQAIHFAFLYADHIKERSGNKTYGIDIAIDFTKIKTGQSLLDIIGTHQLYMMTELCHNLCTLYKQSSPKKRTPWYDRTKTKTYQRRATQGKKKK